MDTRDLAFFDWQQGMKYKDIAEKYGVSLSAIKSWATRDWKNRPVATNEEKKLQPAKKKLQPKGGAPPGNKNATGHGGQPRNKNSQRHGGYSAVYWDSLDDDELALLEDTPTDEEILLNEQLRLYTIRERRLIHAIQKYRGLKDESGKPVYMAVSGVHSSTTKRVFDTLEEKELYEDIKQEKMAERKISYLGRDVITQSSTEATINIIQRLESELTSVQRAKTQCISALSRIHADNHRKEYDQKRYDLDLMKLEATLQANANDDGGAGSNFEEALRATTEEVWGDYGKDADTK